jgi:hypothetical protein
MMASTLVNGSTVINNKADDIVATTTTKALCMNIAIPRVHRCYIPPPPSMPLICDDFDISDDDDVIVRTSLKSRPERISETHDEDEEEQDQDDGTNTNNKRDPSNNDETKGGSSIPLSIFSPSIKSPLFHGTTPASGQPLVYDDQSSSINPLLQQVDDRKLEMTIKPDGGVRTIAAAATAAAATTNTSERTVSSSASRNKKLDVLRTKQQSTASVASSRNSDSVAAVVSGPIQGVHMTEGVVVELRPVPKVTSTNSLTSLTRKASTISNDSPDAWEKAPSVADDSSVPPPPPHTEKEEQQQQPTDKNLRRGKTVKENERMDIFLQANLGAGTTFTVPDDTSIQSVSSNTRESSGEIIGYVAGDETPKTGRHKRINSNVDGSHIGNSLNTSKHKKTGSTVAQVIKDIVTAEEMAAVVKIAPPPQQQEDSSRNGDGVADEKKDEGDVEDGDDQGNVDGSVVAKGHTKKPSGILDGMLKMVFGATTVTSPTKDDIDDDIQNGSLTDGMDHLTQKRFLTQSAAVDAIKRRASLPPIKDTATAALAGPDGQPLPNTEIKVEVLVQLALKNLHAEGHLLNNPVCTSATVPVQSGDSGATLYEDEWVTFTILVKDPSIGVIIERLERIGVGSSVGTISIFRAEFVRTSALLNNKAPTDDATDITAGTDANSAEADEIRKKTIAAARKEWMNAASRLRVEQVKEQIHEQAQLSFDYVSLLTIASVLAGIGLITNSTVVIVASMLVSPIMAPVMGFTFVRIGSSISSSLAGAVVPSDLDAAHAHVRPTVFSNRVSACWIGTLPLFRFAMSLFH